MIRKILDDRTFSDGDRAPSYECYSKSLSGRSAATLPEIFAGRVPEFSRLEMGAKVGVYAAVLTESNTRGLLRRKTRAAISLRAARFERRQVHNK